MVPRRGRLNLLEHGRRAILRLGMLRRLVRSNNLDERSVLDLVVVEESALGLSGTRSRLHETGVVVGLVPDALEVSVVLVLGEPAEDVDALLPVELEAVRVLVVDVVLSYQTLVCSKEHRGRRTNLGRHLVDVNSLLDPKLGDEDVERLVEYADDGSRSNDGSVALSEVGDEDAKEEVSRLLLGESSGVLLDVAGLRDLRDGFGVEREPGVSG